MSTVIVYSEHVSKTMQSTLWEIIKTNMGNNSLDLFKEFYQQETIKVQINGAYEIFYHIFGEHQAKEMLKPVLKDLEKESN